VLFDATDERFIPEPVRGHTFYVLNSEQAYQDLYNFLLGQAGVEPRPLGKERWTPRRRAKPLVFGAKVDSGAREGAGRDNDQGSQRKAPAEFTWPAKPDFSAYIEDKRKGFAGRKWLFESIDQWCSSEVGKSTMLVLGDVGVGKTAFMAELAHRKDESILGHFFCRYDRPDMLAPGDIVIGLAAQMAAKIPAYREAVAADESLQDALNNARVNPVFAWTKGVVKPLCDLDSQKIPAQHLLILIDALDESAELLVNDAASHDASETKIETGAHGRSLIELVAHSDTQRLPKWLRVVMTSRNVRVLVQKSVEFEVVDLNNEELRKLADEDLREYISNRLASPAMRRLFSEFELTGLDAAAFVDKLIKFSDGKFLLAKSILDEVDGKRFFGPDIERLFIGAGRFTALDHFFYLSFEKRVAKAKLQPEIIGSVLTVVAVALAPIPLKAIADVLKIKFDEVQCVYTALSGLLRPDSELRGITFMHFSLEEWLRADMLDGGPKAPLSYHIDTNRAEQAYRRLTERCKELLQSLNPLEDAATFRPYLEKNGVTHLVKAKEFDSALSLLKMLQGALQGEDAPSEMQKISDLVVDGLKRQLQIFERTAREADREVLRDIDASNLKFLLNNRDYETGKYVPVIRILIEYHPAAWDIIKQELLNKSDDLVFRQDAGVAYAKVWHDADAAGKEWLVNELAALARDQRSDNREIAGYALKHICQGRDGDAWWEAMADTVQSLAARFASSDRASDRMVAGEILLALAVKGEPVTQWFTEERFRPFWDPHWGNLRADIVAIEVLVKSSANPSPLARDREDGSREAAAAQHEYAQRLRSDLLDHPFFGSAALEDLLTASDQQGDDSTLADHIEEIERALDNESHDDAINFIRLLMLHPLWNETERAANLVAMLIKRNPKARWPIIDELLRCESSHWRLRYGAIDAAYTAGPYPLQACDAKYAKFRELIVRYGREANPRIRGICADDLRAWINQCCRGERRRLLTSPDVANLIRGWLADADDIWLLEYLYLLFAFLDREDPGSCEALMPATLANLLDVGDKRFYKLEYDDFMQRIEARQRQSWKERDG
jgi:hypothetical protein